MLTVRCQYSHCNTTQAVPGCLGCGYLRDSACSVNGGGCVCGVCVFHVPWHPNHRLSCLCCSSGPTTWVGACFVATGTSAVPKAPQPKSSLRCWCCCLRVDCLQPAGWASACWLATRMVYITWTACYTTCHCVAMARPGPMALPVSGGTASLLTA